MRCHLQAHPEHRSSSLVAAVVIVAAAEVVVVVAVPAAVAGGEIAGFVAAASWQPGRWEFAAFDSYSS